MAGTNFKPAVRTSWATGLPTQPDKPCVKCKGEATGWVSYEYASGKKNRLATGHRPVCGGCVQGYCDEQNAKADKPKGTKGRKKARARTTVPQAVRSPEEQAICDKYPDRNVKPGSWLPSGGRAETHGKKATVVLVCACGAERVVATSDVFQVRLCVACSKTAAKNKADKRKQEKA